MNDLTAEQCYEIARKCGELKKHVEEAIKECDKWVIKEGVEHGK